MITVVAADADFMAHAPGPGEGNHRPFVRSMQCADKDMRSICGNRSAAAISDIRQAM
jgi:hypothetical protein